MLQITSLQNPKIKEAVRLRDRKAREESSLFLIEGYRELLRAIDAGRAIDTLFICPKFFLGSNERNVIERANCQIIECSPDVFAKISYRDRPDGLLAIAPQMHRTLADLDAHLSRINGVPLIVVAERIEKPGNLGTILRSCDAAGVSAVIVCDPTTDIHNPNVVRASVGTLFTQFVFEADGAATLAFLQSRGIAIAAATPHATLEYTQLQGKAPLAIAVGAEQYGLSDPWMKQANLQFRIPMFGTADSLNVASATTLVLYEIIRQRRT